MSEKLSEGDLLEYLDFWLMETHKPSKDEIRAYAQIKEIVTMWFTILETGAKTIDQEALQKPTVSREELQGTRFYKNCCRQRKVEAKICQDCPFRKPIELAEVTDENY